MKQFKTGKEVTIPIAPKLLEVLQGALAWKAGETDYVCSNIAARYNKTDARGKNVGNNLVNIDMLRVIRWIGLEPSVAVPGRDKKVTVYGFHSLRHSFASYCAEAGVPQATGPFHPRSRFRNRQQILHACWKGFFSFLGIP